MSISKNYSIFILPLLLSIIILFFKCPLLTDYPIYLTEGHIIFQKIFNPDLVTSFAIKPYPVPNILIQILMFFLLFLFTPIIASKLILILYLFTSTLCLFLICKNLFSENSNKFMWILFPLIIVNTTFWLGNINFLFGTFLFLLFYSIVENKGFSNKAILIFSILIFFSHAITFFFFILYCFSKLVFKKINISRLIAFIPSLSLLVSYILLRFFVFHNIGQNTESKTTLLVEVGIKIHSLLKRGPLQNILTEEKISLLGSNPIFFWILFGLHIVFLTIVGFYIIRYIITILKRKNIKSDLFIYLLLGVYIASTFLPSLFLRVYNFSERLLIIIFSLFLLKIIIPKKTLNVLFTISVLLVLVNIFQYSLLQLDSDFKILNLNKNFKNKSFFSKLPHLLIDCPSMCHKEYYEAMLKKDYSLEIFYTGLLLKKKFEHKSY